MVFNSTISITRTPPGIWMRTESPTFFPNRPRPMGELVDIMDVGFTCAYLATSLARRITGGTVYVDGGANIIA